MSQRPAAVRLTRTARHTVMPPLLCKGVGEVAVAGRGGGLGKGKGVDEGGQEGQKGERKGKEEAAHVA